MSEISEEKSSSLAIFCEITGCDTQHARTILESVNWNLEGAVTLYYEEQNINEMETLHSGSHAVSAVRSGEREEVMSQGSTPQDRRKLLERVCRYFKIFTKAFGASLSVFFGFFKAIFYVPNMNRTTATTENTTEISEIERARIEESRRIREEQDLEYMKSLNLDSIKQEKQVQRQRSKDSIKERRQKAAKEFQQEIEIERENCSRVCVKNPEGRRFQRSFHKDDKVFEIFRWIDSLGLEETNMISEKFTLRLPHSKSVEINETFSDSQVTIEEIGFFPNVLLLIFFNSGEAPSSSPPDRLQYY